MWAKQAIKATLSSSYLMAKTGIHSLIQHMEMELADSKEIHTALQGFNDFHPIGVLDDVVSFIIR